MWFGTKDGLNRYDGYQFTVFRHDPFDSTSISDSEITALFEDSRGRLWVGTRSGGVNRFDRGRERFQRIRGLGASITALAEDSTGAIWAGSATQGLFRLTTNRGSDSIAVERFVHDPSDPSSLSGDRIGAVLVDRRGVLWVGTERGLDRRARSTDPRFAFTHFTSSSTSPLAMIDSSVTSLLEDSHGRVWIGSIPGISVLDSARTSVRPYYHRYRTYRYGWGKALGLVDDRTGKLWISTSSELMRLDPTTGVFEYFRHDAQNPQSINSDLPTAVYRDRSEVIWVATNGFGLNVHDP
jgi:ligand-binding sensor domain-containing protein